MLVGALRDATSFATQRYLRPATPAILACLDAVAQSVRRLGGVAVHVVEAGSTERLEIALVGFDAPTRSWVAALARRALGAATIRECAPVGAQQIGPDAESLTSADIGMAMIPTWRRRHFQAAGYLLLPPVVRQSIDLERPPEERLHRDARRTVRAIDLGDYSYTISRDPADLERFYERMYLPSIAARHGTEGHVRSRRYLRLGLRHGALLHVLADGHEVAGALNVRSFGGSSIENWAGGVLDGDGSLAGRHADAATYWFSILWARSQRSCRTLGLTVSRPCLTDGLFRFKRKWGASVSPRPGTSHWIALKLLRPSAAAVRFLEGIPFIIQAGERLQGLAVAARGLRGAAALWSEGLDRLTVMGPGMITAHEPPVFDVPCDATELPSRLESLARTLA